MNDFNMAYQFNVFLGSTSQVPGDLSTLWAAMPLDQQHVSFPLFDPAFPETTTAALHSAPLSLSEIPGADSPSTHDAWTSSTPTTNKSTYTTPDASTGTTPDISTHTTTPDVSAHPTPHISAHPAPQNLGRKVKLTRNGKPKPKEKELNPAEDIPTTAPSAMVACRWGTCTKDFRARDWNMHFNTDTHRTEMLATTNAGGSVDCLWAGCPARMHPTSVAKHVRSQHIGTYEFSCAHCGFTARGDAYVGAHGLARDCRMRPATPQLSPGTSDSASASTSAGPATPSEAGSSTSRRHERRYMPYDRPIASSHTVYRLDDAAQQELALLLESPWPSCEQPLAEEAPPAPLVQLPVLSPRPIRPVRLDVFDRMLPDTYTPVVEADAVAAIAPAAMPLHPEAFVGSGHESSILSSLSPDDALIYAMVGGITRFDSSFVFNPDLTL